MIYQQNHAPHTGHRPDRVKQLEGHPIARFLLNQVYQRITGLGILLLSISVNAGAVSVIDIYVGPLPASANPTDVGHHVVESLSDARSLIQSLDPDIGSTVRIHVAPGEYLSQPIVWKANPQIGRLQIIGQIEGDRWPVFRPHSRRPSTFLGISPPGELLVQNLEIRDFWGGLRISCGRTGVQTSTAAVRIAGNRFIGIGPSYSQTEKPAYAALSIVGCPDAQIKGNAFVQIENNRDNHPELIHAIYLAHGSAEAIIEHNTFRQVTGAPIKLRDGSGHATIRYNFFEATGQRSAIQQWFCDVRRVARCRRRAAQRGRPECPSHCNNIMANKLRGTYGGRPLLLYDDARPGTPPEGCPDTPCP